MFAKTRLKSLHAALVLVLMICMATVTLAKGQKKEEAKTNPTVILETNVGKIEIELWPDVAPATVENFLDYITDGYYDQTIFHRVVRGNIHVIQGGGFDRERKKKNTSPPIKLEAVESNRKYTIAMARSGHPDSATSQFFINTRDNTVLDPGRPSGGYAVFGKVNKGAGVVDQIARIAVVNKGGPFATLPAQEIFIKKAYVKK